MTFISIIIPFNHRKRYLEECLDSLMEQNIDDGEVILILNRNATQADKEPLDDLMEKYTKLNIKVKEFDNEIGVAKARNIGLELATGKYVYFIDADDYIYSNGLAKLIEIAKKTDADFINGHRLQTSYVKERFEEMLQNRNNETAKKGKKTDTEFSINLIVDQKSRSQDNILTVLHALIKREIIIENNLEFDEEKEAYIDYPFILDLLQYIKTFKGVENALYGKRISDNPIDEPNLNQMIEERFPLFIQEYNDELDYINKHPNEENYIILKKEIKAKMLRYYIKRFSMQYRSNWDEKWTTSYLNEMSEIAKTFENIPWYYKKEINALKSKDKKALKKWINIRLGKNKAKQIIKEPWRFDTTLYYNVYNKQEIKENQIIFESFRGDYYSDSPKYIYEYLYKHFSDKFEFVWVINDKNTKIPGNPKKVKRFSREFYKELAVSKYWVINGRQAARLKKRPEQIIVSTWHGTPLKKLGLDIDNIYSGSPQIKKIYAKNASEWEYLISPNEYTSNILKRCFAYEKDIHLTGYPRNDILYNATEETVDKIKEKLNLDKNKKIILYAPTWRDDEFYEKGQYKFSLKLNLDKLKESLGEEYILLVRTHYFIADKLDLSDYKGFAVDVSRYDDIAELYLISDILITDYSSVFFDFANLRRPILFYTYDLDKYQNMLRGFYIDIHTEVPGPLVFTTEEIIDKIKNIDKLNEEYKERYDEFYERFCSVDDGNASKRIVEKVWT
ncbi:MAG: CDP-glycerol:glycerophosphate glycerophosphotransferase [archaeon]|nr:CDP-glycerol:glycerophosphate glycerophosphotransferase [archaeon]